MGAVTMLNSYQEFGWDVPAGMSTADALAEAGLTGWNQRMVEPVVMVESGTADTAGLMCNVADLPGRDGTRRPVVLGATGKAYKPIQVEDALTPLMDGWVERGLRCETLGSYNGGRNVYAVFTLPSDAGIAVDDDVLFRALTTKANDGTGAVRVIPVAERVACANMIPGLARKSRPMLSVRHTRSADPYVMQTAEVLLGLTADWSKALLGEVRRLEKVQVSRSMFVDRLLPEVLGARPEEKGRSQTIYDRKFDELVAAWGSPVAVSERNGWRAYNAVTEWEQHHRSGSQRVLTEALLAGRSSTSDAMLALLAG